MGLFVIIGCVAWQPGPIAEPPHPFGQLARFGLRRVIGDAGFPLQKIDVGLDDAGRALQGLVDEP